VGATDPTSANAQSASGGAALMGLDSGFSAMVASLGSSYGLGGSVAVGGGGGGGSSSATASTGTGATTPATPGTAVTTPAPGGTGGYVANPAIVAAVKSVTSNKNVQIAMLMGSALESSQRLNAEGGGGYGPWQIQLSAHPGITQAQAENAMTAARLMAGGAITEGYIQATAQQGSLWQTNPMLAAVTAAYDAERPAAPYTQTQTANVAPAYNLALSEVGDPTGGAAPGPISSMPSFGRSVGGGGGIVLNMPIQVVGVSQQDAQMLAQMVKTALQGQAELSAVSGS